MQGKTYSIIIFRYEELYADVPDSHRQTYLGMVTAMDDAVGEVVAALKETDM